MIGFEELLIFLSGAVTTAFGLASLFFLRFWRGTGDSLFLRFAVAFALLALSQALLGIADLPAEGRAPFYLLRLAAFGLIIWAVAHKNRAND